VLEGVRKNVKERHVRTDLKELVDLGAEQRPVSGICISATETALIRYNPAKIVLPDNC
jgi:hypothetical protein